MFGIDVQKIIEEMREDARKAKADKDSLYQPLSKEAFEYLHTKFFTFGRMVSGTKSVPYWQECVFNGNICTKTYGKIWFGDLRLTTDTERLQELANLVGETLYVLKEHDARFENEVRPLFDKAVAKIEPKKEK